MVLSLTSNQTGRLAQAHPLPEALALRFRVYCEEFGYLRAADYPTGLETDADDVNAAHFHLFETRTLDDAIPDAQCSLACSTLAGYVRLVRPDGSGLLPVQRRCRITLANGAMTEPMGCAEVSRLIIAPEFRRQRTGALDIREVAQGFSQRRTGQALSTDLLLPLFRQMFNYSRAHGIRHWFAAMERPLARSLAQMGFPFRAAGPEGEYFGRITPYQVDLQELKQRVAERQPRLAQWLLPPPGPHGPDDFDTALSYQGRMCGHRPPPQHLWHADR